KSPVKKWFSKNDAETIFERLEHHGKSWKIYVMEPMRLSFHGIIHYSRLKDRLATHVVPFAEFERDAAAGTLPDFSLIEPNFISGHGDYPPAFGRSLARGPGHPRRPPAPAPGGARAPRPPAPPPPTRAGAPFLARICAPPPPTPARAGANVGTPARLGGGEERGAPYARVPPGRAPP